MPPTFLKDSFRFEEGEEVPEHIEAWAYGVEQDPNKFWLQGEDTLSYEKYPLAMNINDFVTARILQIARLRLLEETQPSADSGGQSVDGIQDAVHIRLPIKQA